MKCRCLGHVASRLAAVIVVLNGFECVASWTIEPADLSGEVGWSLYLDTDPSGAPHAAYFTTNPNGDFHYSRRGDAGWQRQAVIDNANAFALDHNGDKFFVSVPGPNFYPHFQTLLDNGLLLGQQLASTRISDVVFLDFDSQNRPQIGWVDTTAQQIKHSFWIGTAWTTRTVASGAEFRFGNSGFAATLDDTDQMHFSWRNEASRLRYAKPAGTTWQISTPFPTADARPYDIDVDADGNVHLAYDVSTGNVFTGGLFYSMFNGSNWNGGRIPGLDAFGVGASKLVIDSSGEPHLFTYDSTFSGPDTLKHVYRESGAWTNETIDSYTSNTSGPQNIEAMYDAQGFHVLYATGNKEIYYAFQPAIESVLSGDYDQNGVVDAADYAVWREMLGTSVATNGSGADGDSDGQITQADYDVWRANYGRMAGSESNSAFAPPSQTIVPEPTSILMLLTLFAAQSTRLRRVVIRNCAGAVQRRSWLEPSRLCLRIRPMRTNDRPAIAAPEVTLRIPGTWSRPEEFYEKLPRGCHCTAEGLVLVDGSEFELHALPADEEFPRIFAGSCAKLPTESEREQIEYYKANICLTGLGGSIEAAKRLMAGAAAVLTAGGAGVFVDNSGIAHGATDWLTLFGDANGGGVYWAFVCAVRSEEEVYSRGMHVLGFRDAIIPSTGNAEYDSRTLHSFLGYTAFSGATIQEGEVFGDALLPTFRAYPQADDRVPAEAPMFNPYGQWRLVPLDTERN